MISIFANLRTRVSRIRGELSFARTALIDRTSAENQLDIMKREGDTL